MATTPFLTTVSGTETSFVPLPKAWSSAGADCAQAIYQQVGGSFLGWDPWYADYIDGDLTTCWPPQASSWWSQDASPSTSLGPTFVCPSAYHEAYASSVDSHTTKTICCPSGYDLYVTELAKPTFPSQCTSTLTAGETLSWEKIYYVSELDGDTWTLTSTTVQSDAVTIFGVPINGFNVVATSTSTPPISTSASAGTSTPATSASSSSTPSASSSASGSTSIVGLAVGASVGAVVGVLVLALAAFSVWRRRHGSRDKVVKGQTRFNSDGAWNGYSISSEAEHTRAVVGHHTPGDQHAYELKGSQAGTHELAADRQTDAYELPVENGGRH